MEYTDILTSKSKESPGGQPIKGSTIAVLLLVALLWAFLIVNLAGLATGLIPDTPDWSARPWALPMVNHTVMLLGSLTIILILSTGRFSSYGFTRGHNLRLVTMALLGLTVGIAFNLIGRFLPLSQTMPTADYSWLERIIFVWFYASIAEEVFVRGLIQSFLAKLRPLGLNLFGLRLSLPVIFSGALFATMHLGLLTMGISLATVGFICVFTFALGLVAAYHRERTGSLIPAIVVHMFGNIGGSLLILLATFAD